MIYIIILLLLLVFIFNNSNENFKNNNKKNFIKYNSNLNTEIKKLHSNNFNKNFNLDITVPITTHSHFKYDNNIDQIIDEAMKEKVQSLSAIHDIPIMNLYDNLVNDGRHIVTKSKHIEPNYNDVYFSFDKRKKYGNTDFSTY